MDTTLERLSDANVSTQYFQTFSPEVENRPIPEIPDSVWSRGMTEVSLDEFPAAMREVLEGTRIGVIARGVMPPEFCRAVVQRFDSQQKGGYRFDDGTPPIDTGGGAHALFDLGDIRAYLETVPRSQAIADFFDGKGQAGNPIEGVLERVGVEAQRGGGRLRPFHYQGRPMLDAIYREWGIQRGPVAALIHEDNIQCATQVPPDCELQACYRQWFASLNFYFAQGERGGETTIYRHIPTLREWREQRHGAYGFRPEMVERMQRVIFRPEAGDVVCFASNLLHSVAGIEGGRRVTRNSLCGIIGNDIALYQ